MIFTWREVLDWADHGSPAPDRRIAKSDSEWQAILTPEAYHVTRRHGTERAFSSDMCSLFEPGEYACICCGTLLFDSKYKYESGTGWPSFTQPVQTNVIAYHRDNSMGAARIETTCSTCDAHLGHVFPDGPEPSGLRFCMNAVVLDKVSAKT
jgi:peptide-methionine (R)-S-oxide reductase